MEQQTIIGLPKFELGSTIKIAGMVLEENNAHFKVVLFPEAEKTGVFRNIRPTHEEWKELLHQLDVVEVEVLDPTNKSQKVVVRKSQREIEQQVNWNVFRRDNYTCRYCGNDKTPLTVDHVVCWESMGASVEDNLITACRKCNKTRGNMLYEDWLKSDYYIKHCLPMDDSKNQKLGQ
jgi:5-methylcytosine-specific restriction endonuclease McrA